MSAQGTPMRRARRRGCPGTTKATPKGAWTVTFLLFLFMVVNFADKIVVGLAGVPIMTDLKLEPEQFGLLGSSFFFLFSISAIVVGFIVNKVADALGAADAGGDLGAGAVSDGRHRLLHHAPDLPHRAGRRRRPGGSVAMHAIYKWFPDEKRTLPTAILSQGSAFGVILAVPALNWVIVNHSWHYAFGALGVVGLIWVVAWLALGKEGPLDTAGARRHRAANSLCPAPDLAHLHRLRGRDLRRLLGAVARAHLVHVLHHQGSRLLAIGRRLDLDPALGVRRHHRDPDRLDLAGDDGARLHDARSRAACSARCR